MSGAGKSTLASEIEKYFISKDKSIKILDGDKIRSKEKIKQDFTFQSIIKNNIKIINKCKSLIINYDIIVVAVIAPLEETRIKAREILGDKYIEIFLKTEIKELIVRDTKGFYKKALNGEISNFIGIDKSTPYETPKNPNLILETDKYSVNHCVEEIINYLLNKEYII